MAYCDENDIYGNINQQDIIPFLDDDGDGQEDAGLLDTIIANSDSEINGYIGSIYVVPVVPTPSLLKTCSIVFACEALYVRRLTPDEKNPFKARADKLRDRLEMIGAGEMNLDSTVARAFAQGSFETVPLVVSSTTI